MPLSEAPGDFQLRGKLGVLEGRESFSARFLWFQQGPEFTIDLWGPLGQGRVRLTGDAQRLAVLDGDGAILTEGPHAEVMLAQLGWTLPLAVLPNWVLGEPGDDALIEQSRYDDDGRLLGFEQLDWAVVFSQHREIVGSKGARWVPRKITARKGNYQVRLVISEWQI
ncbi:MAG: lipoprotein insertase outer membrane protein LolB [Gammaproteobacteria bacterium]|nr:lipoprotein insertase outer membrane protein LolB [Gammaproteobacteria bacterium]